MNILGYFKSKKQEVLKTDELRRITHAEVATTRDALDNLEGRVKHLSKLFQDALDELATQPTKASVHPHVKRKQ